jgi:hypothetical protein
LVEQKYTAGGNIQLYGAAKESIQRTEEQIGLTGKRSFVGPAHPDPAAGIPRYRAQARPDQGGVADRGEAQARFLTGSALRTVAAEAIGARAWTLAWLSQPFGNRAEKRWEQPVQGRALLYTNE